MSESRVLGFILPNINIYYLYGGKQLLQKLNPEILDKLDLHTIRKHLPFKKWLPHILCRKTPKIALLMLNAKALLRK